MTFVLLWLIVTGPSGAMTSGSAAFNSQPACMNAGQALQDMGGKAQGSPKPQVLVRCVEAGASIP